MHVYTPRAMPIYEYVCMECESHFEELVRNGHDPDCPDCGAANVRKQFSVFATHGTGQQQPSVGGVSPDSPVGRAIVGRAEGDEVTVEAPRGTWKATIVSIRRSA